MGMINEAAKNFLADCGIDAVEVTGIESDTESSGYCDTCYYESVVVVIGYKDSANKSRSYTYYGDFGDFIRTLDSYTDEPVQD